MDKIDIFKKAANYVVGASVTRVVASVVSNNILAEKTLDRVAVKIGVYVIGGMVSNVSKSFTDAKIDEAVTFWNNHVRPRIR